MERTTALSTAGAFTLTAAAAVSALFLTMDRGAGAAAEATDPAVMEPEVVTEYEVVQLQPDAPVAVAVDEPSAADVGEIVYEVEYVQAEGAAPSEGEYGEAEYEEEHEDGYEDSETDEDEYGETDEEDEEYEEYEDD